MRQGERQVAKAVEGIRADHRNRYLWAARMLEPASLIVDLACGVGYGSRILAEAGHGVLGIDIEAEAIEYAWQFYSHDAVQFRTGDANAPALSSDQFHAAVCFETIEHLQDPTRMLAALRASAPILLASVPNQDVVPISAKPKFHHRHYRPHELRELIEGAGYTILDWWGQVDAFAKVEPDCMGRTIIVRAIRGRE